MRENQRRLLYLACDLLYIADFIVKESVSWRKKKGGSVNKSNQKVENT